MPDCDQFARVVGRYGRAAVAALERTVTTGAPMDHYALARLVQHLFKTAGGIPCLTPIIKILNRPQLPVMVLDQVATVKGGDSTLDLVTIRSVQRAIIERESAPEQIMSRVVYDLLHRHVVHAKGGLLSRIGAEKLYSLSSAVRTAIEPVARITGERLVSKPAAIHLRVAKFFPKTMAAGGDVLNEVLA